MEYPAALAKYGERALTRLMIGKTNDNVPLGFQLSKSVEGKLEAVSA